jgi:4-hydroxy-2-oxovalerate aldolase
MTDLLDCTLRDGSYVNGFQFTVRDTKRIARALDASGISMIEIGHGLGLGASRKGGAYEAAASDEQYLQAAAEVVKTAKVGMFCIPGIASLDDIDLACASGLGFIRIGTNVTEVRQSASYIERAKRHGLLVCTNYMKSYVLPPMALVRQAHLSKSFGADVVYVVDSAGGMLSHEVEAYVRALRDHVEIGIGYHGHNNMGLAVSNSILCATLGVQFVDVTLQGLGRSAGNASTEQVAMLMNRMGLRTDYDVFKLMDAGYDFINPLMWQAGLNPIDMVAGYALFHSSYMPLIKKFSNLYCVDPRKLIIEVCKSDRVNAPEELVEQAAKSLTAIDRDVFFGKYNLDHYHINEQG